MNLRATSTARFVRVLMLCALLAAWSTGLARQHPPARSGFTGYNHTAWRAGQGAPGDIWDIQQDDAGTLWLATGSGLYSFDGQRFQRREDATGGQSASLNMITLFVDRPGSLWIGYYHAGIGHLSGESGLASYGRAEGVPAGVVSSFAYDNDGVLWAAVEQGLRRFINGRWERLPPSMGVPERRGHWLLNDSRGTFWALVDRKVWFIPKGDARFRPTGIDVSMMATLAESPSGEIWLADRVRGAMPIADANGLLPAAEREARRLPEVLASRIHFTSDGILWAPLRGVGGIVRVMFNGKTAVGMETFDVPQGLTSTSAVPIFEDREGNIWVGTNLGLNRFRAQSVRVLAEGPSDPYRILAANADGDVFGYGEDMVPYDLRRARLPLDRAGLQAAALADPRPLWQFEWTSLALRRGREILPIQFPGDAKGQQPQALYFPNEHEAWACVGETFFLHYARGTWSAPAARPRTGCTVIAPATDGTLLVGFANGELAVLQNGAARVIGKAQGLNVGAITAITAIAAHPRQLLVAGEKGLALSEDGQRFGSVSVDITGALEGITGIVVDPDQHLWLNGGRGLVRLDLASAVNSASQGTVVSPRLFDDVDGMPGVALQSGPIPTARLADDGLLWLATNQGLAWLDTRRPHRSRAAPITRTGNVHYGDTQVPLTNDTVIPAGITQLQIDYVAQSLARPERNRYRYRLSGVDAGWRDAGNTTTAYYTNLGPGTYSFDVIAASEDGVWNTVPDRRTFRIAPTITQSLWFRSLVAIALALLVAAAARMRARHITAIVRARFDERLHERERIARDLHDTLLQGSQGLLLRLHAISTLPALPSAAQEKLEAAMLAAENALREGRDRVSALRADADVPADLATALSEVFREEAASDDARLRITVDGPRTAISPPVLEEIYLIGREAIRNAVEHSGASAIEVEIAYGPTFRLHVRDDGRGMEPDRIREGHWGLQGMRERAGRLGARLTIWSRPGLGTEVAFSLPASHLVDVRERKRWWQWRPRAR